LLAAAGIGELRARAREVLAEAEALKNAEAGRSAYAAWLMLDARLAAAEALAAGLAAESYAEALALLEEAGALASGAARPRRAAWPGDPGPPAERDWLAALAGLKELAEVSLDWPEGLREALRESLAVLPGPAAEAAAGLLAELDAAGWMLSLGSGWDTLPEGLKDALAAAAERAPGAGGPRRRSSFVLRRG